MAHDRSAEAAYVHVMEDRDMDIDAPVAGSKEIGALAHLYRAEVYRSTIWRQRLDMTTNWAVVSTGIALSVSFASATASPLPIALVGMLSVMFLFLEARRYRYFAVWKFRARLLELAVMVPILRGEGASIPLDRGTALSDDYLRPRQRISAMRAVGHRLRRNYLWIFTIQYASYLAKIWIHPIEASSVSQALERAHVGAIPGWLAVIGGTGLLLVFISISVWTWWVERKDKSKMSDYLEEATDE
ncbi:DUF2270 domain-containing protein [Henriciella litoralis]|uniref:DUF2270 domain-containing protein n=1 Tax=Henriciella litoralis TaxID=568102 RepID=UPI001F1F5446|nr:DUF2270 domain-containing protein [Henriciella litoralis]